MSSLRLFNSLTRHQILLEELKEGQARQINSTLKEIETELKLILIDLDLKTLDALTNRELSKFVTKIKAIQNKVYSRYTKSILKSLEDFSDYELSLTASIFEQTERLNAEEEKDENQLLLIGLLGKKLNKIDSAKLWESILKEPLPANGVTTEDFLNAFAVSAALGLENLIRKGYANAWTKEELLKNVIGSKNLNYKNGLFNSIYNNNKTVVSTLVQNVTSQAQQAAASIFYKKYIWISILDSRTTEICLSRSKNVYLFGKGPLPPAHLRCRSYILPTNSNVPLKDVSYYSWIKGQPLQVQNDILGLKRASSLRKGTLKADAFQKFISEKPLSLDEYKIKSGEILEKLNGV